MARQKVSTRDFIDADGNVVDRMEQATGARYTLEQNGKAFDAQFGTAGSPETMFAIFGFHTKVGNVANTVLNDKDAPGTADDAAVEIEAFLESTGKGVWREPSESGPRGPKYDNAILAEAFISLLKQPKGDVAHYAARFANEKSYRAQVLVGEGVKDAYWKLAAARGLSTPVSKDVDTLA